MKKILYIVSTLRRTGPTNQLYNIINNLDRNKFQPILITLSPEEGDSQWSDFEEIGVKLYKLNLSRLGGFILARRNILNIINYIKPHLIHTQGIRADSLLSSLKINIPWVMTSRNFPAEDYPTKFGLIKGKVMAKRHISAMKKCSHLVSCSFSIKKKLSNLGIDSIAIQNGVRELHGDSSKVELYHELARPIFISVGSLIPRKNMGFLIEAFQNLPELERGSLIILGDGPLRAEFNEGELPNVYLLGNVPNVPDFLAGADYFVSSSLSEGLPNTVLEALAFGLPCILSDIDPHTEIAIACPESCSLFNLTEGIPALSQALSRANFAFDEASRTKAKDVAIGLFSANSMSLRYQEYYDQILEGA